MRLLEADEQLVVDLDELDDQAGEPARYQFLVGGRSRVRVVRRLKCSTNSR
jgi:hypothetical protein